MVIEGVVVVGWLCLCCAFLQLVHTLHAEDTDRRGVWLRHDIRETTQRLGSVFLVGRTSSQDVTVAVTLFLRFRKSLDEATKRMKRM